MFDHSRRQGLDDVGPDLGALRVAVGIGLVAIAGGGVGSIADIASARDAGAEGAVVGRAALEGRLDLASAIASFA